MSGSTGSTAHVGPLADELAQAAGAPAEDSAASAGRKLVRHASHYSLSSLLSVVAGLVTFPLLTRTLSVHDYGVLSLVSATLGIAIAVGKLGLQHALVRYHSEIAAGKSPHTLAELHSTTLVGMLADAAAVALALLIGAQLAPAAWLVSLGPRALLSIVALLLVVGVVDSGLSNLLIADQRSEALLRYQFIKKYLGLGGTLVALLLIAPTLASLLWARLVTEALALLSPLRALYGRRRELRPHRAAFSGALYRKLLAFGLPMAIGYELAGVVLNVGDRYVIDGTIGAEALGRYSAAYGLCQYVQSVFISSIGLAIMPIYMRMWDEEGAARTAAFIGRSLRNYILLAAPVIAGLASVGPELLPSLASEKYAGQGNVIPWVSAGMVVDGVGSFVGAGLFVRRKAATLSVLVFSSAVANIAMNLVLVPRLGTLGAALSTLAAYSLLCLSFWWYGRPLLAVEFPWATTLRALLAAVVMFAALGYLLPGQRLLTVAVRAAVGAPIYVGLIAALDEDARALLRTIGRSAGAKWEKRVGRKAP